VALSHQLVSDWIRTTLTHYPRILNAVKMIPLAYSAGFHAPGLLLRTLYYSRYGNIVVHSNSHITGGRWLTIFGKLTIGKPIRLLTHPSEKTIVDLHGELCTRGDVAIGRGCRIWVGDGARCVLADCYISGNTLAFIRHGLTIGPGSAISWGCQFLDDDWNSLLYSDKRDKPTQITIGEHVWIGSNVSVLKGVTVGDGCAVAAGSVVTHSYPPNCLIGGNPARVLKENIRWTKDSMGGRTDAFTALPAVLADR
jgi:hypothetical protein